MSSFFKKVLSKIMQYLKENEIKIMQYLKRDSNTGVPVISAKIFKNTFFEKKSTNGCFSKSLARMG